MTLKQSERKPNILLELFWVTALVLLVAGIQSEKKQREGAPSDTVMTEIGGERSSQRVVNTSPATNASPDLSHTNTSGPITAAISAPGYGLLMNSFICPTRHAW